jgi:mRNA-degrading endonuclease RelE of RelBE toxin-antitoxin system
MTNEPRRVVFSGWFKKELKQLYKRYRHIQSDIQPLIRELERGEEPGDQVPGVGYPVYKVRVRNSDIPKGKSGGYRVLYYVRTAHLIVLITIYAKSDQADISRDLLRKIIEALDLSDE